MSPGTQDHLSRMIYYVQSLESKLDFMLGVKEILPIDRYRWFYDK